MFTPCCLQAEEDGVGCCLGQGSQVEFLRATAEPEPFLCRMCSVLILDSISTSQVIYSKRKNVILFETITFPMREKSVIYQTDLALAELHL